MSKRRIFIAAGILFVLLLGVFLKHKLKSPGDYHSLTRQYQNINVKEIGTIKGPALIYLGSYDCPYCVDFVNMADPLIKKMNSKKNLYYIDMEQRHEDSRLIEFMDTYKIEYVPSFLYVSVDGETIKLENLEDERTLEKLLKHLDEKNEN